MVREVGLAHTRISAMAVGRERKARPGSNPGHPQFMKGVLTTELPSQYVGKSSTLTMTTWEGSNGYRWRSRWGWIGTAVLKR